MRGPGFCSPVTIAEVVGGLLPRLGKHLADRLYVHSREIVRVDRDAAHPVDAPNVRTLAEESVVCCRQRASGRGSVQVDATMGLAGSVPGHPEGTGARFLESLLRPIHRVNSGTASQRFARMEVSSCCPEGTTSRTRALTVSSEVSVDTLPFASGVKTIQDLLSEFEFADGGRSLGRCRCRADRGCTQPSLFPLVELRPADSPITKNAESADRTTCAACAIVPVLGYLPIGVKRRIEGNAQGVNHRNPEGRTALLFDNLKGRLDSQSLEAFVSGPTWKDRLLRDQ